MKKPALFILFLTAGLMSCGQPNPQQVVAAAGNSSENRETIIEWSLGETVIATLTNGSITLTQGFQQPGLSVTVIKSIDGLPFAIEVYPNPTDDLLLIKLDYDEARDFQYLMYDVNGKVLIQSKPESDISAIDMKNYTAGVYLLKVLQSHKEIMTFEIIKH
ncbi:MAG: hypothetical protein A2Y87_09755 [Bacteroidetes bacterium RBG_13_46_8]|nr:MAG: hypothetical protein A2Y87_09755 [Bacteroidetes bacterium RBG_13_46_8]